MQCHLFLIVHPSNYHCVNKELCLENQFENIWELGLLTSSWVLEIYLNDNWTPDNISPGFFWDGLWHYAPLCFHVHILPSLHTKSPGISQPVDGNPNRHSSTRLLRVWILLGAFGFCHIIMTWWQLCHWEAGKKFVSDTNSYLQWLHTFISWELKQTRSSINGVLAFVLFFPLKIWCLLCHFGQGSWPKETVSLRLSVLFHLLKLK